MHESLTFPVCSFKRVFDTHPQKEVLTLAELVACFRRFELKPQLHAKIVREIARIDRALEQMLAGEEPPGERAHALREAAIKARSSGADPTMAMRSKAEEMRAHARASAKRDLRLWSPVLYREDGIERGSEGVTHVSCLVLDYDSGVRIRDATSVWQDWFHMVHTTWSHTPEHPKFRVIMPLAVPVPAAKWETLWLWGERESGGEIDRSMKGAAATYALPATPAADWPKQAITHAGKLLDPRELGIEVGNPVRLPVRHAPVSPLLGDPEKEYVVHDPAEAVYVYDDPEWDEPSATGDIGARPSLEPPAPASSAEATRAARVRRKGRRQTVCVDFDGVLHSYRSGWRGGTVIPDPPTPGAIEWLARIHESYDIAVLSTRTRETGAVAAMRAWLCEHGLAKEIADRITFPRSKPPARIYIDDRGWRFTGAFPSKEEIDAFVPWNRSEE